MHFEQIDDAFDPVEFAQDLLGNLLVIERLNAALEDHYSLGIRPSDLVAQEVRAALESVIDSSLQFVSRGGGKVERDRGKLCNGHESTFN